MKPVVYIDILFILNTFIDFILLYVTGYVCKARMRLWRLSVGAVLGGLYACLMFFPGVAPAVTAAGKLLITAGIVAAGLYRRGIRAFLKMYAVFWMVSAAFGGVAFALVFFTGAGTRLDAVVSNGEFYLNIGMGELLAALALAYAGVYVFTRMCRRNFSKDKIILPLRLFCNGRTVKVRALIDTGCELCDPLDGQPVMIAWQEAIKGLLSKKTKQQLRQYYHAAESSVFSCESEWAADGVRLMPFSSVGAEKGFLPAIRLDCAMDMSGRFQIADGCYMGIMSFPMSDTGMYDVILNPDMLLQQDNTQKGVNKNAQKMSYSVSDKVVSVEVSPRIHSSAESALYWGRRGASAPAVKGGGSGADCCSCTGGECGTNSSNID